MQGFKHYLVLGETNVGGYNIDTLNQVGYELQYADFRLGQGIDSLTGAATTFVQGGTFNISVPMLPPPQLLQWGMSHRYYHNGAIITVDMHGNPVNKYHFKNGACTFFSFTYTQRGEAYPETQLTIHAEQVAYGDNINEFDNRWTNASGYINSSSPNLIKERISDLLPLLDTALQSKLVLDGQIYDLETFSFTFEQEVDHKGQPQSETIGGVVQLTVTQALPAKVFEWARKDNVIKPVQIMFQSPSSGTVLDVNLTDALCVQYMISLESIIKSNLVLSAHTMTINGNTHNNRWDMDYLQKY